MRPINVAELTELLGAHQPPCLSIYMPTERCYPANQQGPIRYRNLLDRAEEALHRTHLASVVQPLLRRFRPLADDSIFWTHRVDGLAVLGSPDYFRTFDIQRPTPERLVAGESFHIKPLVRVLQSADRFQVLCLTREKVRMLQGNRDALDDIPLNGVPATIVEALGDAVGVKHKVSVQGGKSAPQPRPAPHGEAHGHAAKGDDAKLDAERFFPIVDRGVWERHSRPTGLPLILVALPQHQALFRSLSHNPHLLPGGIEHNPETLSEDKLRKAAWEFLLPHYEKRLAALSEDFRTARAQKQGTDDLEQAAHAAFDGRVGRLLIDADRHIPGRLDPQTRQVHPETGTALAEDMLDDLAEQVLRTRGEVVVVPSARMPTATGLAAIYRY